MSFVRMMVFALCFELGFSPVLHATAQTLPQGEDKTPAQSSNPIQQLMTTGYRSVFSSQGSLRKHKMDRLAALGDRLKVDVDGTVTLTQPFDIPSDPWKVNHQRVFIYAASTTPEQVYDFKELNLRFNPLFVENPHKDLSIVNDPLNKRVLISAISGIRKQVLEIGSLDVTSIVKNEENVFFLTRDGAIYVLNFALAKKLIFKKPLPLLVIQGSGTYAASESGETLYELKLITRGTNPLRPQDFSPEIETSAKEGLQFAQSLAVVKKHPVAGEPSIAGYQTSRTLNPNEEITYFDRMSQSLLAYLRLINIGSLAYESVDQFEKSVMTARSKLVDFENKLDDNIAQSVHERILSQYSVDELGAIRGALGLISNRSTLPTDSFSPDEATQSINSYKKVIALYGVNSLHGVSRENIKKLEELYLKYASDKGMDLTQYWALLETIKKQNDNSAPTMWGRIVKHLNAHSNLIQNTAVGITALSTAAAASSTPEGRELVQYLWNEVFQNMIPDGVFRNASARANAAESFLLSTVAIFGSLYGVGLLMSMFSKGVKPGQAFTAIYQKVLYVVSYTTYPIVAGMLEVTTPGRNLVRASIDRRSTFKDIPVNSESDRLIRAKLAEIGVKAPEKIRPALSSDAVVTDLAIDVEKKREMKTRVSALTLASAILAEEYDGIEVNPVDLLVVAEQERLVREGILKPAEAKEKKKRMKELYMLTNGIFKDLNNLSDQGFNTNISKFDAANPEHVSLVQEYLVEGRKSLEKIRHNFGLKSQLLELREEAAAIGRSLNLLKVGREESEMLRYIRMTAFSSRSNTEQMLIDMIPSMFSTRFGHPNPLGQETPYADLSKPADLAGKPGEFVATDPRVFNEEVLGTKDFVFGAPSTHLMYSKSHIHLDPNAQPLADTIETRKAKTLGFLSTALTHVKLTLDLVGRKYADRAIRKQANLIATAASDGAQWTLYRKFAQSFFLVDAMGSFLLLMSMRIRLWSYMWFLALDPAQEMEDNLKADFDNESRILNEMRELIRSGRDSEVQPLIDQITGLYQKSGAQDQKLLGVLARASKISGVIESLSAEVLKNPGKYAVEIAQLQKVIDIQDAIRGSRLNGDPAHETSQLETKLNIETGNALRALSNAVHEPSMKSYSKETIENFVDFTKQYSAVYGRPNQTFKWATILFTGLVSTMVGSVFYRENVYVDWGLVTQAAYKAGETAVDLTSAYASDPSKYFWDMQVFKLEYWASKIPPAAGITLGILLGAKVAQKVIEAGYSWTKDALANTAKHPVVKGLVESPAGRAVTKSITSVPEKATQVYRKAQYETERLMNECRNFF
jgi:hypothetical protein